jgi:acetyl-CoA carboxylase biotin carboxyl carrier protein
LADDASSHPDPFDVRTVRYLAALMSRHDLSEIDLRDGEHHIRLRRGMRVVGTPVPAAPAPISLPIPVTAAAPPPPATTSAAQPPAKKLHEITSPTPGTFYAQEKPDAAPYVAVGSRVTPSTVVCKIEAMKIFNDITADCTGVITEILVENKQPVDYGTVLFRVDPAA